MITDMSPFAVITIRKREGLVFCLNSACVGPVRKGLVDAYEATDPGSSSQDVRTVHQAI